jgi:gliding motility-associated-like protein
VNLNLAVSPNSSGTDVQSACESFTWIDGITYTSSTNTPQYTIVGGNANGCDSVVNLDLTIFQQSSSIMNVESCGAYLAENGQLYSESTTFSYVLSNSNGCDSTVTVNLTVTPKPIASFTSSPELLEFGLTEIQLIDQSTGQIDTWDWVFTAENGTVQTSNLQNPIFNLSNSAIGSITFQLTVSDGQGCSDDVISVLNIIEDAAIYIPNTFSPDGDAFNNTFHVFGKNIAVERFELCIFNRWGEQIFTSKDPSIGWDGSVNNNGSAPIGVYTYKLTYRFLNQSKNESITGHFNLIR